MTDAQLTRDKKDIGLCVSAGIKRQQFHRSECQHQLVPRQAGFDVFQLIRSEKWLTIVVGRLSGGACWRASSRNNRLVSSRTMGGRGASCALKKHIGPIDPDAFTLNKFLNLLGIRATTDVPVDSGCAEARVFHRAVPNAAGPTGV